MALLHNFHPFDLRWMHSSRRLGVDTVSGLSGFLVLVEGNSAKDDSNSKLKLSFVIGLQIQTALCGKLTRPWLHFLLTSENWTSNHEEKKPEEVTKEPSQKFVEKIGITLQLSPASRFLPPQTSGRCLLFGFLLRWSLFLFTLTLWWGFTLSVMQRAESDSTSDPSNLHQGHPASSSNKKRDVGWSAPSFLKGVEKFLLGSVGGGLGGPRGPRGPLAWHPLESQALPLPQPSPLQAPGKPSASVEAESHGRHGPAQSAQYLDLLLLFDLLLTLKMRSEPRPLCHAEGVFGRILPRNRNLSMKRCWTSPDRSGHVPRTPPLPTSARSQGQKCLMRRCGHRSTPGPKGCFKRATAAKLNVQQSQLPCATCPGNRCDKVPFRESFACNAWAHEPNWEGENAKACPTTGGVEVWIF